MYVEIRQLYLVLLVANGKFELIDGYESNIGSRDNA